MNVLHVIPSIAASDGGPSEAAVQICRALVAHHVDTTLAVTTKNDDDEFLTTARSIQSTAFSLREFSRFGFESFKYSPGLSRWLRDAAGQFSLTHIHAVFSHPSIAAMRHARNAGKPYLIRPLGNLAPYSLSRSATRKRLFLNLGLRDLIESATAIHCTSEQERDEVAAAFRIRRTIVVPNGVDDRLFEPGSEPREPLLAFVGRLHPKKNCEALIAAFSRCRERHPDWRLVIGGDGDPAYANRLRALAKDIPAIRFTGWLDFERKRELLRRASLFVLPSAHENFAIAAAEAMAAGVPVILTPDVGISSDVASNEAGWVSEADPARLETVIEDAMTGGSELVRRGTNARRLARERFCWEKVGEQLRREYETLLA